MGIAAQSCPLVLIEWEDSARPIAAWMHLSDYKPIGAVQCASVGWLIQDDDQAKALAPNMGWVGDSEQVQACGIIHIPTRAVIQITRLKEPQVSGPKKLRQES